MVVGMELKDFISQALVDIVEGVKKAQGDTSPGTVVPPVTDSYKAVDSKLSSYTSVAFEVQVTADASSSKNGGLKVAAGVLGVGVGADATSNQGSSAKLAFSVPLKLSVSQPQTAPQEDAVDVKPEAKTEYRFDRQKSVRRP